MKSIKRITLLGLLFGAFIFPNTFFAQTDQATAVENNLLPSIVVKGDTTQTYNLKERMQFYNVPGVSIAVVVDGKIAWAKGYGIANTNTGTKVDVNTLFQAGSISKPVAALAALHLVENGKLDLDTNVNTFLTAWKVPNNNFTQEEKVTLRRLLTHNAGMTVHGFPGYTQEEDFPTITQVLNGQGNTPAIVVDTIPGSIWRYSGGGYTVMEKIVEDVSGMPLEEYMEKYILSAMNMTNSTYEQPLGDAYLNNVSAAYNSQGELVTGLYNNYPEQAAAGLWTTPTELAKYCIEIQQIMAGKEDGVLKKSTVQAMLTKHMNDWGLGPSLRWAKDSLMFGHGGKNQGFSNTFFAFAKRGQAVIVMTNADQGTSLMREIVMGVSDYYNWDFSKPREVELIQLAPEKLNSLAGKYLLDFQVPGVGDYYVNMRVKDGMLSLDDPNEGSVQEFSAMTETRFIDLSSGDRVAFKWEGDTPEFTWNGQYRLVKVKE